MALVARPDITLVDAPVAGAKQTAKQGELTIFASGPDEARRRVRPIARRLAARTSRSIDCAPKSLEAST